MTTAATLSREERIVKIKDTFHALMWIAGRQFSQMLQSFGLTHAQFMALGMLVGHDQACTMSDLTSITFQDAPTMTGIIDRLVKMKLVQRTRSERDRRVVLVEATPAGVELIQQIEAEIVQRHQQCYEDLSDDQLSLLEHLLRYIVREHLAEYKSLDDVQLAAEIKKLQNFKKDPLYYAKLHSESVKDYTEVK